jgi:hypothetical protein
MKLLPHWSLTGTNPAFYDTESATAIEQTAKVYGAMQTLISEYNSFVDEINKEIEEFESWTTKDVDTFKKCITNIVSNYIQSVDIRLDNAEAFMKENLDDIAQELISEAIRLDKISIIEVYNEETESLNLIVSGEV